MFTVFLSNSPIFNYSLRDDFVYLASLMIVLKPGNILKHAWIVMSELQMTFFKIAKDQ